MSEDQAGSARRRAREVALQVLFAIDIGTERPRPTAATRAEEGDSDGTAPSAQPPPSTPSASEAFDAVSASFEMPVAAEAFARELVAQVRDHVESLDETIASYSKNWRISRMAVVDRNILRLGTWELRFTDTPSAVILNEAVDMARRFSNDPSPAFVNGILDAIARGVREYES